VYRRVRRFGTAFPDFSEIVQTTREQLRVDCTCTELEGVALYRTHFSAGFQLRSNVSPGRALLALLEGPAKVVEHGRLWPAGAFALSAAGGIDAFSLSGASIAWIEFTHHRAGMSQGMRGAIASERGEFVAGEDAAAARLARAVGEGSDDLLPALDAVLADGRRLAQRATAVRRYQLVLDAEDYMAQHIGELPLLDALGAELGCSARTLIYAFTQVYGIGPMAYFKLQRLNAIHRRLSAGDATLKISELAPRYGFRHMGHFSTDYRLMFGRPPSQSRFTRKPSRGTSSA